MATISPYQWSGPHLFGSRSSARREARAGPSRVPRTPRGYNWDTNEGNEDPLGRMKMEFDEILSWSTSWFFNPTFLSLKRRERVMLSWPPTLAVKSLLHKKKEMQLPMTSLSLRKFLTGETLRILRQKGSIHEHKRWELKFRKPTPLHKSQKSCPVVLKPRDGQTSSLSKCCKAAITSWVSTSS